MAQGFVAPGFERVAEAFDRNFAEGLELGAAFAAYRGDDLLVDLWGGVANRPEGKPWTRETLQLLFSGSKGLVATVMAMLLDRGQIALDRSVATYWPEFGKPEILIRHIVSHTARLPGLEHPTTLPETLDPVEMARRLAAQQPSTDPRAGFTYHAFTYGWLCGEVVRRVTGKSAGAFIADEIAGPLGLDIYMGLPAELEPRVSRIEMAADYLATQGAPQDFTNDQLRWTISSNPEHLTARSFYWNEPETHRAVLPGAGAIAASRDVAKLYSKLANGGAPLLSKRGVDVARTPLVDTFDQVNQRVWSFGVGFELNTDPYCYGPPDDGFGHGGAGGSSHGAWPSHGIGFSYSMNLMHDLGRPDPRAKRLLDALYDAVNAGA
jgi:CubicO group peptidase (beta-lactamase class C family)